MNAYPKDKCIIDALKTEFDKKCKPNPGKNSLDYIKSVDPTTLPPCSKALMQQIKRACYVVHLYSTAYDAYPAFELFPVCYAYKLSENGESWRCIKPLTALKSLKFKEMKEKIPMKMTLTLTILTPRMKSLMMLKFILL